MNERLEGATLYRAMVKVWDPAAGEWVVTAEAVDTLAGLVSWAALGVGASAESRSEGVQDRFFAVVADAAARVVSPPYRAEDIAVYVREAFGLSGEEQGSLSAEERVRWQQIACRFLSHPYGSFLNPA